MATMTVRRPSGTQPLLWTFDGMAGFIEYLEVPGRRPVNLGLLELREARAGKWRASSSICVPPVAEADVRAGSAPPPPLRGRVITADRRLFPLRQFRFAGGGRFDRRHPYIPYGSYGFAATTCPLPR